MAFFYEPRRAQRAQRKRGERKDLRIIANTYLGLSGESGRRHYLLGIVKLGTRKIFKFSRSIVRLMRVNVWAYVEAYPDEIDSAIRGQDEADEILYTPENKPMARILCRRTLSPTSRPGI